MDNRNYDNQMPVANDQQANIDVQMPLNNRPGHRPLFVPVNNINLQAVIQYANLQWQAHRRFYNQRPQGLTADRIQRFQQFQADQSLVGEECAICLADIEVGRRMMRLDCNGRHVFCQDCVETWFANNNTCPYCNHVFV